MSKRVEIKGSLINLWGDELEDSEPKDKEQTTAALKLKEVTDRIANLSDKVLPTFEVTEAVKKISESKAEVNIGKLAELMVPIVEYYEVNQDIIDRVEEWPALTGLTINELDQMELHEVINLIRERTTTPIKATDTLKLVVVDTAIKTPKPGGAINQAEATRTISEEFYKIPSGPATALVKKILNNPSRVTSPRRGQIKQTTHRQTKDSIITYKGKDSILTATLEQTKELFTRKIQNGAKVWNFLMEKLNEQHRPEIITFTPTDLISRGIYANKDSTVKGLNNVFSKMYYISLEGEMTEYNGKKKTNQSYGKSRLIAAYKVNYTNCEVAITPLIRNNTQAITILPTWAYTLNDNAYMLLDYIYYLARQEHRNIKDKGHFNISLEAIRNYMGLPTVKKAMKHQEQLIQRPIEKAIEEIENTQSGADIKITPLFKYDPHTVTDWLQGWIQIELGEEARTYMEERAIAEEKEYRKHLQAITAAKQKALEKAAAKAIQEAAATIEK